MHGSSAKRLRIHSNPASAQKCRTTVCHDRMDGQVNQKGVDRMSTELTNLTLVGLTVLLVIFAAAKLYLAWKSGRKE